MVRLTAARSRLYDKPLAAQAVIDIIDHLTGRKRLDLFIHQHADAVDIDTVLFSRLIQSQPQAGSPSAKALENDPQHLAGIISEQLRQCLPSSLCDFHVFSLRGVIIHFIEYTD